MGEEIGRVKFGAGCRPISSIASKISEIKINLNKAPPDLKYVHQSDFNIQDQAIVIHGI